MIAVPMTVTPQTTSVPVEVAANTEVVMQEIDPVYMVEEHEAYTGATTFTPGTSTQTAQTAGKLVNSDITVEGDTNLVAANIVTGKSIFGVAGSAPVPSAVWDGLNRVLIIS